MIDFQNGLFFKLQPMTGHISERTGALFVEGEEMICAYKAVRDKVVFTNKRILCINTKGVTGSKIDYTSLPYNKIVAFSVETSGTIDNDSELDLFFTAPLGVVRLEFTSSENIRKIGKIIGEHVL